MDEKKAANAIIVGYFEEFIDELGSKRMYRMDHPEIAPLIEVFKEKAPHLTTTRGARDLLIFFAAGFRKGVDFAQKVESMKE